MATDVAPGCIDSSDDGRRGADAGADRLAHQGGGTTAQVQMHHSVRLMPRKWGTVVDSNSHVQANVTAPPPRILRQLRPADSATEEPRPERRSKSVPADHKPKGPATSRPKEKSGARQAGQRRKKKKEAMSLDEFEQAVRALQLPALKPAEMRTYAKLPDKAKAARRKVLEKNGARASILLANAALPLGTLDERVSARLKFEREGFRAINEANREVRLRFGRAMTPESRRTRLFKNTLPPLSESERFPSGGLLSHAYEQRAVTPLPELPEDIESPRAQDAAAELAAEELENQLRMRLRRAESTKGKMDPESPRAQNARALHSSVAEAVIANVPSLRMLGREKRRHIAAAMEPRKFDAEEEIITQGHHSSAFFVVDSGTIAVLINDLEVATLGRNDYFGEVALVNDKPRHATCKVVSSEGALCMALSREAFDDCVKGGITNSSRPEAHAAVDRNTLDLSGFQLGHAGCKELLKSLSDGEPDIESLILCHCWIAPTKDQENCAMQEVVTATGKDIKLIEAAKRAEDKLALAQKITVVDSDGEEKKLFSVADRAVELRKEKLVLKAKREESVACIAAAWRRFADTRKYGQGMAPKRKKELDSLAVARAMGAEIEPDLSAVESIARLVEFFIPSLKLLNLSNNKLGLCGCRLLSQALAAADINGICELIMNDCHIGDEGIIEVLNQVSDTSPHLKVLELSGNQLGNVEVGENSAAEALRKILEQGCCDVTEMCLGYNNFRKAHIMVLASALRDEFDGDCKLMVLDLGWNSLGDGGAMWLADALRENHSLLNVNLSHNEIKELGAFVLADMLKENQTIRKLTLDSNVIGQRGCRAILRCIRKLNLFGWSREISFVDCNISYMDLSTPVFDPAEAGGQYELNLSDPYERSVAFALVELAWDEQGENWHDESLNGDPYDLLEPPPGEIWTRSDFDLPKEGILRLRYESSLHVARYSDVVEPMTLRALLVLMTNKSVVDRGLSLVKLAAKEWFFTAKNVGDLISMMGDSMGRAECACALVPRVVDPVNIMSETFDILSDGELTMIAASMGDLFYFNRLNPTGHYRLKLGNKFDRQIAWRIAELAHEQSEGRKAQNMIDTSQKRDWDNFRNETFNGRPHDFDVRELAKEKFAYGTLEFDFVSTDCSHRFASIPPMPDHVFEAFMLDCQEVFKHVILKSKVDQNSCAASATDASTTVNAIGMDTKAEGKELCVKVLSARGLAAMDSRGSSDPYAVIKVGRFTAHTSVVKQSLNPVWDAEECFQFRCGFAKSLEIELFDADPATCAHQDSDIDTRSLGAQDDKLGMMALSIQDIEGLSCISEAGCTQECTLLADGEQVGHVTVWLRIWEPKMSQVKAATMLQSRMRTRFAKRQFKAKSVSFHASRVESLLNAKKAEERIQEAEALNAAARRNIAKRAISSSAAGDGSPSRASGVMFSSILADDTDDDEFKAIKAAVMRQTERHKNEMMTITQVLGKSGSIRGSSRGILGNTGSLAPMEAICGEDLEEDSEDEAEAAAEAEISAKSSPTASPSNGRINFRGDDWQEKLTGVRSKLFSRVRPAWWVPSLGNIAVADSPAQRIRIICARHLRMVRQASLFYGLSAQQVERLVAMVPDDAAYADDNLVKKPVGKNHVEMIITVWSRVTNLEALDLRALLGHTSYDADGNGYVTFDELERIYKETPTPYTLLTHRLGQTNVFNAMQPDGHYALNLSSCDERKVASLLVILGTEPGENLTNTTYDGLPFEIASSSVAGMEWRNAVPEKGMFCCEYVTPRGCASLPLRLSLARRLSMPGKFRWHCVPPEYRIATDDPTGDEWGLKTKPKKTQKPRKKRNRLKTVLFSATAQRRMQSDTEELPDGTDAKEIERMQKDDDVRGSAEYVAATEKVPEEEEEEEEEEEDDDDDDDEDNEDEDDDEDDDAGKEFSQEGDFPYEGEMIYDGDGLLIPISDALREAAKSEQEKIVRQARQDQKAASQMDPKAKARAELERLNALSLKPAVTIALKFIAQQLKLIQGKKASKRLAAVTAAESPAENLDVGATVDPDAVAAARAAKEAAAAAATAAAAKEAAAAAASLQAIIVAVDLAKFNWNKVRAKLRSVVSNAAKAQVANKVFAAKVEKSEQAYAAIFQ